MIAAAMKASQGLVRDFGEVEHLQVSRKGPGDFVSKADRRSEEVLIRELSKSYADYNFITEESGEIIQSNSEFFWIIDPLDGTSNFLHGLPHFSISIALRRADEVVAGIISDPMKDELCWTEKGRGAFLNQRRIRASGRTHIDEILIGVVGSRRDKRDLIHFVPPEISQSMMAPRCLGSAALDLAYVACGRLDAFVGRGLFSWDVAAGTLLVQESGGKIQSIQEEGSVKKNILASNGHFFEYLQPFCL